MAWEKYFGDGANWYENTAVAASPKGELLVAIRTRAAFTDRYSNPRIWIFNQNGERTSEIEVRAYLRWMVAIWRSSCRTASLVRFW